MSTWKAAKRSIFGNREPGDGRPDQHLAAPRSRVAMACATILLAAAAVTMPSIAQATGDRSPNHLEVNGEPAPLGIESKPRFSWHPGVARQSAYQVQVGDEPGSYRVWDSGKVAGSNSTEVAYRGPLASQEDYFWRVRVWGPDGRVSRWSRTASWETGLLRGEPDWSGAQWIGGRQSPDHDWTDLTETVRFRGGDDPAAGLKLLMRAEPIGKTWGESLSWTVGAKPFGNTTTTVAASAGQRTVRVRSVADWSVGDVVTVGRGGNSPQQTTISAIGTADVDAPVLFGGDAGTTFVVTDRSAFALAPGDAVRVGPQDAVVASVGPAGPYALVNFRAPLSSAVGPGDRIVKAGTGLTLTDPLRNDLPAGSVLFGRSTMQLAMVTNHYAGNTWVDDGSSAPNWGVNFYDPQSETNPTATGTRTVPIATIPLPEQTGLTFDNWGTQDHAVEVKVEGMTVTTRVNGVEVDSRTLTGDQIRRHGSIGFGANTSAVIRSVEVTGEGARDFRVDLRQGANPFESGIGGSEGLTVQDKNAMLPIANPAPLLRKATRLPDGKVESARLYVSGAGYYDMTVNGRALAHDESDKPRLVSDQATYDRTVFYDTYDVTRHVEDGDVNVLAAELGRGWYGVTTPQEWYWQLAPYVGAPRLRTKLVVTYRHGRTHTVVSDGSWQTADGPTTFDSVYSGEKYDAARAEELGHWRGERYWPGRDWQPASLMLEPGSCSGPLPACHGVLPALASQRPAGFRAARLRAHEAEPVQVNQVKPPVAITETQPGSGVWVVDFGQILTGFPVADLRGVSAGTTVRLRGGNSVTGEGTAASPLVVAEENNFHDANLQTNYYTVGSGSQQTWEPKFSHWGFRYMELRNLSHRPDAARFRVKVARSGFERVGSFRTDNPLLQRINSNLEWAQQNNLVGKPTDTPSREKNGWTGDTMADSETQSLIWDVRRAHEKYLRSFPDGMISTGQLPMILPAAKGGYGYDRTPGWNFTWQAVPAWDSAFFVMPWEQYEQYGNTSLFAELYDHQDRLLRYYETLFTPANNYTHNASLGAYSGAEPAGSNAVISQQFYIYFADYMARVGRMIGKHERAAYYAEKAKVLRKSFVEKYWDEELGYFTQGSISSENTLAIEFGIVPGSDLSPSDPLYVPAGPTQAQNRARLAKLLADRIVAANHHIVNDMYGSRYEFNILDEYGYTDIALKAVTQTGAPGYVDQIAKGATSLWENWTGGSLNHHYRSNVATWFYQGLAGIQPTSPAYATVRVRPRIPSVAVNAEVPTSVEDTDLATHTLDRVESSIDTVRGIVASSWTRRADGRIGLSVTVPSNTEAEIWVPTQGRRVTASAGAKFVRQTPRAGRPTRSTAPPWARTPSTAAPADLTPTRGKGRPTAGRPFLATVPAPRGQCPG